MLVSDLIAHGESPYIQANQPVYVNVYGALFPLIMAPVIKFFGFKIEFFRIAAALFIWLSLLLIAIVLKQKGASIMAILPAVISLYASLLFATTPLTRGDSLGLFLFLCSVLIPFSHNYSSKSLLIALIASIMAFHAKPYFIIGLPVLSAYLFLFESKTKGLLYGLAGAALFLILFFTIKNSQEFYFHNTLYLNSIYTTNLKDYAIFQLIRFSKINIGAIILLVFALLYCSYKLFKSGHFLEEIRQKEFALPFFFLVSMIALIYFKMGGHDGSYMNYLLQLLSPFLLISAVLAMKAFARQFHFLFLLAFNVYSTFAFLPGFGCENRASWEELESFVQKHDNILASPLLSAMLLKNNKRIYDTGLTEFFENYSDSKIAALFYPDNDRLKSTFDNFQHDIRMQIQNQKFDALILTRERERFVNVEAMEKYKLVKTIHICLPHTMQEWDLDIFLPVNG